jgi:hypothetical protein
MASHIVSPIVIPVEAEYKLLTLAVAENQNIMYVNCVHVRSLVGVGRMESLSNMSTGRCEPSLSTALTRSRSFKCDSVIVMAVLVSWAL